MKRIKSFRLFENQFQIEDVIQEIEDILISGGIKDIGYKFVEYVEGEGLSHTICCYGGVDADKRNFNSISEIEGIRCDTILLSLKK